MQKFYDIPINFSLLYSLKLFHNFYLDKCYFFLFYKKEKNDVENSKIMLIFYDNNNEYKKYFINNDY